MSFLKCLVFASLFVQDVSIVRLTNSSDKEIEVKFSTQTVSLKPGETKVAYVDEGTYEVSMKDSKKIVVSVKSGRIVQVNLPLEKADGPSSPAILGTKEEPKKVEVEPKAVELTKPPEFDLNEEIPANKAAIMIDPPLPLGCSLYIDGEMVPNPRQRRFLSPDIEAGQYYYTLRVEWREGETDYTATQKVYLRSGKATKVSFKIKINR